jgi:hypothetical protein
MLCSMQMTVKNHASCLKISRPRETSRHLLKALEASMPLAPPHREIRVVTRKDSLKTEISLEVQYGIDTGSTWLRGEYPV